MNKPTSSVAVDQVITTGSATTETDVNTDQVETQAQNAEGTTQVTDANTDSTQSSGVESEGAKEPKTLEEVVKTAVERSKPKQETAEPAKEDEEAQETQEDAEAKAKEEAEAEEKVPFHNHPRWKEVIAERDEYRGRAEKFDAITSFMDQNSLTPEEVTNGFEVMALMRSNPAEALKRIEEHASNLRQFLGLELPEDLKAKVDEGYVDADTAAELARTRNNEAFAKARLTEREQREAQLQQEQAAAAERAEMANAVDGWIQSIQTRDPDYSFKEAFIVDRVQVLRMQNPPRTKEDAVALVKQAYDDATERLKALAPRRQNVKTTTSAASTTTAAKPVPTTLQEAIEQAVRG